MDMIWYAHKYGLLLDADFKLLWETCRVRQPSFLSRGQWLREGGRWASAPPAPSANGAATPQCVAAQRRFLIASSRAFSQEWPLAFVNDLTLYGPAAVVGWDQPGSLNYMTAKWMMSAEVRRALHVDSAPASSWPGPSDKWSYTSNYAACNSAAPEGAPSMVDFYRKIAPRLKRTIVFNGDTDPCVSYEGTRTALEQVGFAALEGHQYRPWFYDHQEAVLSTLREKPDLFGPDLGLSPSGPQMGGHVVDYEHNLSFVTVHGSGHMVPQFRPQAAEMLLRRLLSGEPFAPPLPTDAELAAMTDDAFDSILDAWTNKSKAAVVPPPAATPAASTATSVDMVV